MQTILGAGGAIGHELAKALTEYTTDIRLVSRHPNKINDTDELFHADLLNSQALERAIKGSSVVYVVVGFPYSYKIWQQAWPKLIKDLIRICEAEQCKLVFFDNMYMYDKDHLDGMTEATPVNPPSKKGKVRSEVASMILDADKLGKIDALIARSADFYGPSISNTSVLTETVFNPLSRGKKANWFVSDRHKHSFTYVPDAGKATALLGNTDTAYGQTWHLPTAANPVTGQGWIETIAAAMGAKPSYRVAPRFLIKTMGLFMPIMKESVEMLYQYDRNYVFDSGKFERAFGFRPTPYETGIDEIVKTDYR